MSKYKIGDRISVYNCSSYDGFKCYDNLYIGDGKIVAIGESDDVSTHGSAEYYTIYTVWMDDGSTKKVSDGDCQWAAPYYTKGLSEKKEDKNDKSEKRKNAEYILQDSKKCDDLKLYDVFEIYKDDLKANYSQLYYALLAWKDTHSRELFEANYK